jgi:hypothetical protein
MVRRLEARTVAGVKDASKTASTAYRKVCIKT